MGGSSRAALLLFLLLIFSSLKAQAAEDLYLISNIKIDTTSESSIKAKEEGTNIAVREAFNKLLSRLSVMSDRYNLTEEISKVDPMNLVQEIIINSEKTSTVRYIADINIKFKKEEIDKFLREHDVSIIQTTSKPVLIVPTYKDSPYAPARLWEDNPWLNLWQENGSNNKIVPIYVPLGDINDMQEITLPGIASNKFDMIENIKTRYSVKDVFICEAEVSYDINKIKIHLNKVTSESFEDLDININIMRTPSEDLNSALKKGILKISEELENSWKQNKIIDFTTDKEIIVMVPFKDLHQWGEISQKIQNNSLIKNYQLEAMRKDLAQIKIRFSGEINDLSSSLKLQDLVLGTGNNVYIIKDKGYVSGDMINE